MAENKARPGDYLVICDYSGFKCWRSDCQMTWDGYLVHKSRWEPRHPQDFVRGRRDKQSVPIGRPEAEDTFLATNEVTVDDL